MKLRTLLVPLSALAALSLLAQVGCGGSMEASTARVRYVAAQGYIPAPEEIRVEEFVADYAEGLPNPAPNAAGMTVEGARAAWGAERSEPLLVVQTAVRGRDADYRPPLALMVVVDRSGSMAEADKMTFVRRGLHQLVDQLDPGDAIGIVAFDGVADVVLPLGLVSEAAMPHRAIDQIQPRGGTNLAEGLRVGYQQLSQPGLQGHMRRVVLLTDAMVNEGDTDVASIASYAARGDAQQIRLSCVGVGLSYRDDVMVEMARAGHGNHYFLDSADEIERVFSREVQGVLEDVADHVYVTYSPRPGLEVVRVEGGEAVREGEHYRVDLGRLGAGQHRVVLWTLRGAEALDATPDVGAFTLDYEDMRTQEALRVRDERAVMLVADAAQGSVARNSAVAWMARDLRSVSELSQRGEYGAAQARLRRARAVITAIRAARPSDTQLDRDLTLLRNYETALSRRTGEPVRELRARVRVSIDG